MDDEQRTKLENLRDNLARVENARVAFVNASGDDALETAFVNYTLAKDDLSRAFDACNPDDVDAYSEQAQARRDAEGEDVPADAPTTVAEPDASEDADNPPGSRPTPAAGAHGGGGTGFGA